MYDEGEPSTAERVRLRGETVISVGEGSHYRVHKNRTIKRLKQVVVYPYINPSSLHLYINKIETAKYYVSCTVVDSEFRPPNFFDRKKL